MNSFFDKVHSIYNIHPEFVKRKLEDDDNKENIFELKSPKVDARFDQSRLHGVKRAFTNDQKMESTLDEAKVNSYILKIFNGKCSSTITYDRNYRHISVLNLDLEELIILLCHVEKSELLREHRDEKIKVLIAKIIAEADFKGYLEILSRVVNEFSSKYINDFFKHTLIELYSNRCDEILKKSMHSSAAAGIFDPLPWGGTTIKKITKL